MEDISFANGERLAVNAVTFYLCPKYGWLIFAGRKDGSIAVYRSDNDKPTRILHEHKMNGLFLFLSYTTAVLSYC